MTKPLFYRKLSTEVVNSHTKVRILVQDLGRRLHRDPSIRGRRAMPVEYEYDEEQNVIYTRFFGVVVDKDLEDQAKAVAADPRIKPGLRELVDLSGIEGIEASTSSLERNIMIDSTNREKLEGLRTAIVAGTDLLYGFSRMYQALAEVQGAPSTVEVFRSEGKAREWLDLPLG